MNLKYFKESLKSFKEYIPILYFILILLGYFNEYIYYQIFNIDIINYLTLQELLFSFIPLGSILLILVLSYIIMGVSMIDLIKFAQKNDNESKSKKDSIIKRVNRKVPQKIKTVIKNSCNFLIIIIPMGIYCWIILSISDDFIPRINFHILIYIMCLWGGLMIIKQISRIKLFDYYKEPVAIITIVFASIFYVGFVNKKMNTGYNIIKGKAIKKVTFIKKNDTITTDDSLLYIGETKSNIFLRDTVSGENIIYKYSDIELIKMK